MKHPQVPDPGTPPAGDVASSRLTRRALLERRRRAPREFVAGRVTGPLFPAPPPDARARGPDGEVSIRLPVFGAHQSGVSTPLQDHLHFAAFDMSERADRRDLASLLQDWSAATARMTVGLPVRLPESPRSDQNTPADDTGEALGLPASGLTVTIGFGPGLFELDGVDRYGIGAARPPELQHLPSFAGDALEAAWSDGDLGVQVCADDPQVAVHAVRTLSRIAADRATIRWSQMGFAGASRTLAVAGTPRNLMGFKDGTNNILGANEAIVDQHVWLPPTSTPAWLAGGTYLVVRKIAMLLDDWDRQPVTAQEAMVGRTKEIGAPLSGGEEFTAPDFAASINGVDVIDPAAHVRLAHPSSNGGLRILRRGYNYVDGTDTAGRLDAGLLFIGYQRSPDQFIAIQRALEQDLINPFVRPIGSAIFVVPPGPEPGGFVGETLLG